MMRPTGQDGGFPTASSSALRAAEAAQPPQQYQQDDPGLVAQFRFRKVPPGEENLCLGPGGVRSSSHTTGRGLAGGVSAAPTGTSIELLWSKVPRSQLLGSRPGVAASGGGGAGQQRGRVRTGSCNAEATSSAHGTSHHSPLAGGSSSSRLRHSQSCDDVLLEEQKQGSRSEVATKKSAPPPPSQKLPRHGTSSADLGAAIAAGAGRDVWDRSQASPSSRSYQVNKADASDWFAPLEEFSSPSCGAPPGSPSRGQQHTRSYEVIEEEDGGRFLTVDSPGILAAAAADEDVGGSVSDGVVGFRPTGVATPCNPRVKHTTRPAPEHRSPLRPETPERLGQQDPYGGGGATPLLESRPLACTHRLAVSGALDSTINLREGRLHRIYVNRSATSQPYRAAEDEHQPLQDEAGDKVVFHFTPPPLFPGSFPVAGQGS